MRILIIVTLMLCWQLSYSQDSLKTMSLEEVAITAVRAAEEAPVPQANLTKKQIEEVYVGQHPIFMLSNLTPGFYAFSESGTSFANYGSFRLRGINQERINITLNGVPLNDMIDQGVFFSNFTDVASNFESIQVQRGVGTSTNGVSSYGGSINFESINLAGKEAYSEAQLGAGSFDTYRGNFQHFTGINEKGWGFLTSFSKLTSSGYRDHTETDATSFFLTGGYYGENDLLKLTFFTARSENGLGYQTVERSILESNPTTNLLSENDEDDFTQFLAQLQYNRYLNDDLTLGITAYYGGAGGDFVTFGTNFPLQNDHFGAIANLTYTRGDLELNTGVHGYQFQRKNEESTLTDLDNPFYNEKSDKSEFSAYAKASYVTGNLSLYGDVQLRSARLNISPDFNAVGIAPEGDLAFDWTFLNPRVGASYEVSESFSVYSSFGRSNREPTKIDIFGGFRLDDTNYDNVRNGEPFRDEAVNDLEIGARLNQQNLVIDGNVFLMSFEDEIAPNGAILDFGVGQRRNIPESTRSGAELTWTYAPTSLITFSGNAAYLNTSVKDLIVDGNSVDDNEQILSPNWIINTQIRVNATEKLTFSLSGRYMDRQFMELTNDPTFTVPSSFVSDASVEAKVTDGITVSAFVNNLFDESYYVFGAVTDSNFDGMNVEPGFLAQPERNYFLSVNVRF
ncbi:MAG: TonB-dependent receptor [Bacteroidota bacterium]